MHVVRAGFVDLGFRAEQMLRKFCDAGDKTVPGERAQDHFKAGRLHGPIMCGGVGVLCRAEGLEIFPIGKFKLHAKQAWEFVKEMGCRAGWDPKTRGGRVVWNLPTLVAA